MKRGRFLLLMCVAGLLQATLLDAFRIFGVKPDLLIVLLVTSSLYFDAGWVLASALFAGIMKDVLSINSFGMNTFLFLAWAMIILYVSAEFSLENPIVRSVLVGIVTLAHNVAVWLVFSFLGTNVPVGIFLRILILETLYTLTVAWFVFRAMNVRFSEKRAY